MVGAIDERTPVLAGVGVADGDHPAVDLMTAAAHAAADDAGALGLLGAVQRIAVPKGTWAYRDPGRLVAERIGAPRATTLLAELGVPQQTLVNDALARIASGEIDVALVVGGEAKRWKGDDLEQTGATPDVHLRPEGEFVAPPELAAGIVQPVQQYALIENARRVPEDLTIDDHLDDIASLWGRFNLVAQANPKAAFPEARPASFLKEPTPDNRPLAFPYNKWHSTQWTVNQAAALLLCTADAARSHGVPEERWVFPRVALESSHSLSLSRRRDLHRWPAMAVLGDHAVKHLGRTLATVEHVEVYSCFPAAVRVQQRELGLPFDGTPTVTGGMAFAGGPLNNFTYQATAAIIDRVRAEPGSLGMVTTVSGLLTKPGLMVWSTDPGDKRPLIADLGYDAETATQQAPLAEDYAGPATVLTYTVTYAGAIPERVAVIANTREGQRCVAARSGEHAAHSALAWEWIGAPITVRDGTFEAG